ncbi:hypothetical protein CDAR_536351 [Caerostris darwini]|uniref:Uncharacterized protein n=1 Tax=Caerostris darwini TaxID=1538125 RepID=A0AAV4WWD6_9ARAC|nr:hypothetical protein CDAR_536351 [Caerostris darwini]
MSGRSLISRCGDDGSVELKGRVSITAKRCLRNEKGGVMAGQENSIGRKFMRDSLRRVCDGRGSGGYQENYARFMSRKTNKAASLQELRRQAFRFDSQGKT